MSPPSKRDNLGTDTGIIFDFDGTLAHMSIDFGQMRREVDNLLASYGIAPDSLSRPYVLERIHEAAHRVAQKDPALAQRIRNAAFALLEKIELAAAAESHLFPGVDRRLGCLKERGYHLAIATRNCEKALDRVMGTARNLFEIILTRENSPAYKPERDALTPILKQFSLDPSHIYLIGDHPLDILTARRIPITPIAVLTGTGKREALLKAGAAYIFNHVNQAMDALFHPCSTKRERLPSLPP